MGVERGKAYEQILKIEKKNSILHFHTSPHISLGEEAAAACSKTPGQGQASFVQAITFPIYTLDLSCPTAKLHPYSKQI